MAPRRTVPPPNTLSPQDPSAASGQNGPAILQFPRANSPSSGFAQFLTKPSKWFSRSSSSPRLTSNSNEPKLSVSSARKHKISRPQDPRPILDSFQASPYSGIGSRSVLDLSSTRTPNSIDLSSFPSPKSPGRGPNLRLGDLKNISRKAWSRSVDDLGKFSSNDVSPVASSFHTKVAQYRERSNSSASGFTATPTTPTSPFSRYGPITNPNPISSSPPSQTTMHHMPSAPSISISAPDLDDTPKDGYVPPLPQVHARSHSFTPRLPSKLSNPKFAPPSPKRKGSASVGDVDRDRDALVRDKGITPGTKAPGAVSRAPFPFSLGPSPPKPLPPNPGGDNAPPTPAHSTMLMLPPAIVEPENDVNDVKSEKRLSQVVHLSGFINRLTPDTPPGLFHHTNHHQNAIFAQNKNWRPFKLEVKGAKLLFHKPPGDRSAAIKDLFPTGFIPEDQPVDDPFEYEGVEGTPGKKFKRRERNDSTTARRKRVFWGRTTHPELTCSQEEPPKIEKGSFEALVHETVFATIFSKLPAVSDDSQPISTSPDTGQGEWRDFASAILLCLPSLIGRSTFEGEFIRCCSYFLSGADERCREEKRLRVAWLASEYLRYHGAPVDAAAWQEWKAETLPQVHLPDIPGATVSTIPTSSSLQGLFVPSPNICVNTTEFPSPDVTRVSPTSREDMKMTQLMEALGDPEASPSRKHSADLRQLHPQSPHPNAAGYAVNQAPLAVLELEGLTREVLLTLDPHVVARSLCYFHRSVLEQAPENLTADFIFGFGNEADVVRRPSLDPLFGNDNQPHWLTKFLLMQILGPNSPSANLTSTQLFSPGRSPDERQTSRTHSRSQVISVWAKIGDICRLAGDECSWRAIEAALCSRPVARLEKAWRRVDAVALTIVESWAHRSPDGECLGVKEPRVTPWGGDAKIRVNEELEKANGDSAEAKWVVKPFLTARSMFEGLRTTFSLCPRKSNMADGAIGEDTRRIVSFWQQMTSNGTSGLLSKLTRMDQFMSLSLAAEPRRKGLYEPFYWSRSITSVQTSRNALIPLLFPEPLPCVTLINRGQVLHGRLDSDANRHELPFIRGVDARLRLDEHGAFTPSLGGTIIPVFNGDLLLLVQKGDEFYSQAASRSSSRPSSRPPSSVIDGIVAEKTLGRSPSIRVKTGSSQSLDRKTSVARRSSLPSISQRPNLVTLESSLEPPLRVVVQAGSLNCLVDVLIHGLRNVSVSVADDNGEMALRDGKTRDLLVDRVEFAKVWWNVFRSFVTPLVFFELLRKSYINSQPRGQSPLEDECLKAARLRTEVLENIKEWLEKGGGAQDVLDDMQLHDALHDFLGSSMDHAVHRSSAFRGSAVNEAWTILDELRQSLVITLSSQTMSPPSRVIPPSKLFVIIPRSYNFGRDAPDIDRIDAEDLIDNLDAIASAAFGSVTEEDLFVTVDLLEVQTADKTGWLLPRDSSTSNEDIIEIQTMYSHIQDVESSNMISELAQDAVYRLFPPGVRSCIRAYGIVRKWLISKIIAPRLGMRVRQQRMDLLLRAIEIARLRSTSADGSYPRLLERPCVRSFVEAAMTSAVVSVESRMYHLAWQNIALSRGVQCDTLSSLLSKPLARSTGSVTPLTVDIGWLLERLLEIICIPDLVEPVTQEGENLINFDKRRQLCHLVDTTPCFAPSRKGRPRHDGDRKDFERLNNMEKEISHLQFDARSIKDEAVREGTQANVNATSSAKKVARPFQRLVASQVEKNRRDKSLRDRLTKEKRLEQQRNDRREDALNKAMRGKKTGSGNQKHRPKKSMSVLMHFMRPISTAFTADGPPAVKRTPEELDFVPSNKPVHVLSLADVHVAQFINNERSFIFQLKTDDGGHYLLQAMNKRDMLKWIDTINRISKDAAKRRLTYQGNSLKPQLSDHIHDRPLTASHDPTAVFGVELQFLLIREAQNGDVQPGAIPFVIERCLQEIEDRGLSEVGIYRIAGATSEINALKDALNRGEFPVFQSSDIHAVCDLVKSWFRVLPEPVFPSSSYHEIIQAMKIESFDGRLSKIRSVVKSLPQANFDLLRRLAEHLDKVTDFEEYNHMTADALAIVFSPNLLRAPHNDFAMILANMGSTHQLVKALITNPHIIFDDPDLEVDGDQDEDDLDSPILQDEDEDDLLPSTFQEPELQAVSLFQDRMSP